LKRKQIILLPHKGEISAKGKGKPPMYFVET
jgi:hypothetical protein